MRLQDCTVFIEKNLCTSRPTSFKTTLFKGQVYGAFLHSICCSTAAGQKCGCPGDTTRADVGSSGPGDSQDLPALCVVGDRTEPVTPWLSDHRGLEQNSQRRSHSQDSNPVQSDSKDSTGLSSKYKP